MLKRITTALGALAVIGSTLLAPTTADASPKTATYGAQIVRGQAVGTQAAQAQDNVYNGLMSANGTWLFTVNKSGQMKISNYSAGGVTVWKSPVYWTTDPVMADPGIRVTLQNDGNLVMRLSSGQVLWNAGTIPPGSYPGDVAYMRNDGRFCVLARLEDGSTRLVYSTPPL